HAASTARGDAVDQVRDQLAAVANAMSRRPRANVLEDRAAEGRGFARGIGCLAQTVNVIHHDGVASITSRLRKSAVGKRILMEKIADRVVKARAGVRRPSLGFFFAAREQIFE